MEHSVQLGTQGFRDSIYQCLRNLCKQEQLPLEIIEQQKGKRWLIQCRFCESSLESDKDEALVRKIHYYYLANALAETILVHWEKEHVRQIVQKRDNLSEENLQRIVNRTLEYLDRGQGQLHEYRINRKTSLVIQILTCLNQSAYFDLEGFLVFRAQEYKSDVHKAVEYALEECIIEKEYMEFIRLLKHFVDNQKPQLECLHVLMTAQGKFDLLNEQGDKITQQFLEDYQLDHLHELGYEDLLVSSLIAVAPRQIILHIRYAGYKDALQTIRSVFGERVTDCRGCSLCNGF